MINNDLLKKVMTISSDYTPPIFSKLSLLNLNSQYSQPVSSNITYRKLNDDQLDRCSAFLEPDKKFSLTPSDPSQPTIQFNIAEIMGFIYKELHTKKISHEPLCLSGGVVCHILTGMDYGDVDLTMNIHSSVFSEIHSILQEFIKSKLDLSKFDSKASIDRHIQLYLYKTEIKNEWAYFNLGEIEIKFIFAKNGRHHVSSSDSFYIPITEDQHVYSAEEDFDAAWDDLLRKKFIVYNPERVEELLFRVVHKQTHGFAIINSNKDVLKTALDQFSSEYVLNQYDKKAKLNRKFHSFFNKHYSQKDPHGKIISFLNFLSVLQQLEDPTAADTYSKMLAAICRPIGSKLITLIENNPSHAKDILALFRGLFLLEWINENPNVSAYSFDFNDNKRTPHLYFSFKNNDKTHYLTIPGDPGTIIKEFLISWRELELECGSDIIHLAKDIGLRDWILTPQTRPGIIKTLLNSYTKEPLKHVLEQQYQGQICPEGFCETIQKETELIQRETPNILNNSYIWSRTLLLQLQYYNVLSNKDVLIQALLRTFSPNINNIKQLTKAFKNSPTDWCRNENLQKLFQNCLECIVEQANRQFDKDTHEAIQELVLKLHSKQLFDSPFRCQLALSLIQKNPTYKFIDAVSTWNDKTPTLQSILRAFTGNLTFHFSYLGIAILNNENCDSALNNIENILANPGQNVNAEIQDLFFNLIPLAIKMHNTSVVGKIAKQMIPRIHLEPTQMEMLFNLSREIEDKDIIVLLEQKSQNKKLFRDLFLNQIIELLTSKKSDEELKDGLESITDSLSKLQNAPEGFLDSLRKIGTLEGSNREKIINTLLLAFVQIDLSLAREVLYSSTFKTLEFNEQRKIRLNLVKSLSEQKLEMDFAFTLWNEALNGHVGIKQIEISLQLIQALNPTDSRIPIILKNVLENLPEPHKKLSKTKIQELKNTLLQVARFAENTYKEQIIQTCLKKNWIKPKHLEGIYRDEVLTSLKKDKLDPISIRKYIDLLFQEDQHFKNADAHQAIESIRDHCEKNEQFHSLYWEITNRFFAQCPWNSTLANWCHKILLPLTPKALNDNNYISFINILINKGHLKNLTQEELSKLLQVVAGHSRTTLCTQVVKEILKLDQPINATWKVLYQFFNHCKGFTIGKRFSLIPIFDEFLSAKKFLSENTIPLQEKIEIYTLSIENLCDSFSYCQNSLFLPILNTQWEQIKTVLTGGPALLKLKNKVLSTFIENGTPPFFIKGCQQLIPQPGEPVNCPLITQMIQCLSNNSELHQDAVAIQEVKKVLDNTFLRIFFEHFSAKYIPQQGQKILFCKEFEFLLNALFTVKNRVPFYLYYDLAQVLVKAVPSTVLRRDLNAVTTEYLVLSHQNIYEALGTIHNELFKSEVKHYKDPYLLAHLLEKMVKKYFNEQQRTEYSNFIKKHLLSSAIGQLNSPSDLSSHCHKIQENQWHHTILLYTYHDPEQGIKLLQKDAGVIVNNEKNQSLLRKIYSYGDMIGLFSDNPKSQLDNLNLAFQFLLNNPIIMTVSETLTLFNSYIDLLHYETNPLEIETKLSIVILIHDRVLSDCINNKDFTDYKLFLQTLEKVLSKTLCKKNCDSKDIYNTSFIIFTIVYRPIINQSDYHYINNFLKHHYPNESFNKAINKLAVQTAFLQFDVFYRKRFLQFWHHQDEKIAIEAHKASSKSYTHHHACYKKSFSENSAFLDRKNFLLTLESLRKENLAPAWLEAHSWHLVRQMILNFFEDFLLRNCKSKESKISNAFAMAISGYSLGIPKWLTPLEKASLNAYYKKLKSLAEQYSPKFISSSQLEFIGTSEIELLNID